MKVYVVTSGESSESDYRIRGVYADMEKAEHAKKLCGSANDIEEYRVNHIFKTPSSRFWHCVEMGRDGHTKTVKIEDGENEDGNENAVQYIPYCLWHYGTKSDLMVFHMWAKDEAHAVKIANEKRVALIANNEWIVDKTEWKKRHPEWIATDIIEHS